MKTVQQRIEDLKSPDADVREDAAYSLRYTRSKKGVHALIEALDDPSPIVRCAATRVLKYHTNAK